MPADLKKVFLFADFSAEEVEKIRGISRPAKLSRGEYAFREGQPGDTLILLDLGTLKLTKKSARGEEQELVQLGSGSYSGEMSLFDQGLRSASAVAMEPCQVTILPLPALRSLLDQNPSMAAKFYRRVAMGISQRLKYLNEDFAALKHFLAGGR